MGRKYSQIAEWEDWIPDLDGEREAYEADPDSAFVVGVRYLTAKQIKGYERILRKAAKGPSAAMDAADEYARRLFCDNVRDVRNYAPKGVDLTTGDQVWDDGEPHVINAISEALKDRSRLEAGLAKKLVTTSDISCSRQTPSGIGGAQDAIQPSTQKTQETTNPPTQSAGCQTRQNDGQEIATACQTTPLDSGGLLTYVDAQDRS